MGGSRGTGAPPVLPRPPGRPPSRDRPRAPTGHAVAPGDLVNRRPTAQLESTCFSDSSGHTCFLEHCPPVPNSLPAVPPWVWATRSKGQKGSQASPSRPHRGSGGWAPARARPSCSLRVTTLAPFPGDGGSAAPDHLALATEPGFQPAPAPFPRTVPAGKGAPRVCNHTALRSAGRRDQTSRSLAPRAAGAVGPPPLTGTGLTRAPLPAPRKTPRK